MDKKSFFDKIIDWYGGAEPPPPPPMGAIPMDASPARSMARATGYPFAEHPGLADVWVRSDRPEEESNPATKFYEEMVNELKKRGIDPGFYRGSSMTLPEAYGEYLPKKRLIHYNTNPEKTKGKRLMNTLWHEFTHPVHIKDNERLEKRLDEGYTGEDPSSEWHSMGDRFTALPEGRRYEDPIAFWVGQMAEGKPVPEGVKAWIEKYRDTR
jgi:hypothetical protein